MTDLKTLDPTTRCVALVGMFLQRYALMESQLNELVVKATGLTNLQGAIVNANTQFGSKVQIARAALALTPLYPPADRDTIDKMLCDLLKYAAIRNTVAHTMFLPSQDGEKVEFLVVRTRGDLIFPEMVWSLTDFQAHFQKIDKFTKDLEDLERMVKKAALVLALEDSKSEPPKLGLGASEPQGLLSPLLQAHRTSEMNPPMPEIGAETPPPEEE